MEKTAIRFDHVCKTFAQNQHVALRDVSFEIQEGEFVTVLGSSGSGKTTALKMINRLIEPVSGEVAFYGQDVQQMDVIQLRRQIGYVVQQIGLFPHMSVAENIATVPELLKWEKDRIKERTNELLQLVQLPPEEYMKRKPKELSGGQQQRVGVARALAADPKLMLLDEPFAAIDAITRMDMQNELLSIHRKLAGKTFVFVTHDISEAFRLGTKVMIMDKGELCQFDSPANILKAPKTDFVKNLINTVREQETFWGQMQ